MSKCSDLNFNEDLLEEGSFRRRVLVAYPWIGIVVEGGQVGKECQQVPSCFENVPRRDGHESYRLGNLASG